MRDGDMSSRKLFFLFWLMVFPDSFKDLIMKNRPICGYCTLAYSVNALFLEFMYLVHILLIERPFVQEYVTRA